MTQNAIDCLYSRFKVLCDELDEKGERLDTWQASSLHSLAEQAEKVLQGCRRKADRRF